MNCGIIGSNISTIAWNNGSSNSTISISPTMTSVYSATVFSTLGCKSVDSKTIIVNPLSSIQIVSSDSIICVGESCDLSAIGNGLISYSWTNGTSAQNITVSPTVTTQYTVYATDLHGCISNAVMMVKPALCSDTLLTGIPERSANSNSISIFPNPSRGSFEIKGFESQKGRIFNDLGELYFEFQLDRLNNYSCKIESLPVGLYFVVTKNCSKKIISN